MTDVIVPSEVLDEMNENLVEMNENLSHVSGAVDALTTEALVVGLLLRAAFVLLFMFICWAMFLYGVRRTVS